MIYTADVVLPMTADPIRNGGILVKGDRIVAVGPDLPAEHPGEPVRDLGECILMPGFVNAHCHLDYTILRGAIGDLSFFQWVRSITRFAKRMEPDDFRVSALLGAAELIQAGVTTVADASFSGAAFDALLESGLRGIVFQEVFGYRAEDFTAEFDDLKSQLDVLIPRVTPRVGVGVSPHSIYTVSAGLFGAVRDMARSVGMPLSIHVAESAAERKFCLRGTGEIAQFYQDIGVEWKFPGVSPVQYLYDLGVLGQSTVAAHCVQVDENDLHILAATHTGVAHCPTSNAKLGVGTAPVEAMLADGVRLGLGSDSAASADRLDVRAEIERSLPPQAAELEPRVMVEAATIGGARALAMDAEIGSLESGKKADFIALDISSARFAPCDDPYFAIAHLASGADVILTVVDGEVLYDRPGICALDMQLIKRRARESAVCVLGGD